MTNSQHKLIPWVQQRHDDLFMRHFRHVDAIYGLYPVPEEDFPARRGNPTGHQMRNKHSRFSTAKWNTWMVRPANYAES